ncbi:MAG: ATP-binding protein [Cyanobacteria bacterium P01_A01_bin.123]
MFQATRRRLALWYTAVTAVLLLIFASGMYLYVRTTLVERVDDTLNHVVEVVERSLVIEPGTRGDRVLTAIGVLEPPVKLNVEASFRNNTQATEDDRIDLEWFSPTGDLLWSTFAPPIALPLHVNPNGETVYLANDLLLRQITRRIEVSHQVIGYLRVSHPWFEVTKPSRQLIIDLAVGTSLMVGVVAGIGWLLSGLAIAPIRTSYQQLKQFTADASHELRNPIAVIQTNVQVALSDPEPDLALQQGQLKVVERLTRRLGRLVDDLLFLARQEGGLAPMQRDSVSLGSLLAEVVEEQSAIAVDQSVHLNLNSVHAQLNGLHASPPIKSSPKDTRLAVLGDADQLTRLFTNLVSNALQYTPAQGSIILQMEPRRQNGQDYIRVTVADTGIGITAEELPHVFDRFYRADPARSRRAGGTGLGLAIAKVIVDNHRGYIQLDSQPNQGTLVTIMLPTHPAS